MFGTSARTTRDLVRAVQGHLRGSLRGPINTLSSAFSPLSGQMVMQFPVTGVQIGQAVEVGLRTYLVTEVNTASQTLGVVPQTEAAAHDAGSRVVMRPAYSSARIIGELNNDLADLSAQGLYRIVTVSADVDDVVTVPDGALAVLDVWSREERSRPLPEAYHDIVVTPDGVELRSPTRLEFAVFGCTFTELPLDDDEVNVVETTGLPATAVDLPPLGAAMNLLAGAESQRNVTQNQGDTRRAAEVPPGANQGAMRGVASLRRDRIVAEQRRLLQRFGYTKQVRVW